MRFSHQELLAGILATLDGDSFPGDATALQTSFTRMGTEFPLLAALATSDGAASVAALGALEQSGVLTQSDGRYMLSDEGRAHCVSSKRTLFNKGDMEQLEGASRIFTTA